MLWSLTAFNGLGAIAGPIAPRGHIEDDQTYTSPLIVLLSISVALFVCFTVKVMYMKYRRIKTIHGHPWADRDSESLSPASPSRRSARERDPHPGLIIGCFGSPSWETRIHSRVDNQACARLSTFSYQMRSTRKTRVRRSPETRSGLSEITSSSSRAVGSASHLGSVRDRESGLTVPSLLRPPRTFTYDGEGMRKTVHLVPRLLYDLGDSLPTTNTSSNNNNHTDDIDQETLEGPDSLRSSIRLINRLPGDPPHPFLYGPLGISRLSPLMEAMDSVSLSKSSSEIPEQLCDPAVASVYLPSYPFSPPVALNCAVRTVTMKHEDAAYEPASKRWSKRSIHGNVRFRSGPAGVSPLRAPLIPDDVEGISPSLTRADDNENEPSASATFGEIPGHARLLASISRSPRALPTPNDHLDTTTRLGVQPTTPLPDNTTTPITYLRNFSHNEASFRTLAPDRPEDTLANATPDCFCLDCEKFYNENGRWSVRPLPSPEIGVAR